MSNLLGDFGVGSNMLGADEDTLLAWNLRVFEIDGSSSLSGLYISPRFTETVQGRTTLVGTLLIVPRLTGEIDGSTDLSSSTLTLPTRFYISGTVVASSSLEGVFAVSMLSNLLGEVGASVPVVRTIHGTVLSEPGVKPDQGGANEPSLKQHVPYFV